MAAVVGRSRRVPRSFTRLNNHVTASSSVHDSSIELLTGTVSSTTTMARRDVPRAALDASSAQFLGELCAWLDDESRDDDDCCGIRVVIARGVTQVMFKRIPESWLKGLVVELSANGDLELMDVEGDEHRSVKQMASVNLSTYALQQRPILVAVKTEYPGIFHGVPLKPDCVVYPITRRGRPPVVIVEIEIHHLGVGETIEKASQYLAEQHVKRVVVFKFFRERAPGFRRRPSLLFKAALAIVFERVGTFQPNGLADIRVVAEVSFGTAPLTDSVLRTLSTTPSRTSPAGTIRPVAASPYEFPHVQMRTGNVEPGFLEIDRRGPHVLDVDPATNGFAPFTFDLGELFKAAAQGWTEDRRRR